VVDLYELNGSALRQFSEASWCRYSGNLGNITYSGSENAAVMVELDLCQKLKSCPSQPGLLGILRDVTSALFELLGTFIKAFCVTTLSNKVRHDTASVVRFYQLFFYECPQDPVTQRTKQLSEFTRRMSHRLRTRRGPSERSALFNAYRESIGNIYSFAFRETLDLYQISEISDTYPMMLSKEQFEHATATFDGSMKGLYLALSFKAEN
jgi:hypothetical protein